MFRVLTPIIRSWYNCNYSLWHWATAIVVYIYIYIHGTVHRESNLITVQKDATYSVYYISVGSSTALYSKEKSLHTRIYYVKTILLISILLFPKYFIITKSCIHKIVLTDFVYCISR